MAISKRVWLFGAIVAAVFSLSTSAIANVDGPLLEAVDAAYQALASPNIDTAHVDKAATVFTAPDKPVLIAHYDDGFTHVQAPQGNGRAKYTMDRQRYEVGWRG